MDPWIMVMMDGNQLDKKLGRQTTILSLIVRNLDTHLCQ